MLWDLFYFDDSIKCENICLNVLTLTCVRHFSRSCSMSLYKMTHLIFSINLWAGTMTTPIFTEEEIGAMRQRDETTVTQPGWQSTKVSPGNESGEAETMSFYSNNLLSGQSIGKRRTTEDMQTSFICLNQYGFFFPSKRWIRKIINYMLSHYLSVQFLSSTTLE